MTVVVGTPAPRQITVERTRGDRVYRRVTTATGIFVLVLLFLIGFFLFLKGLSAIQQEGVGRFLTTKTWLVQGSHSRYGVEAVAYWTVIIAVIALVIGLPLGVMTALCITECAPPRLRRMLVSVVDLLAAIPSVIYGVWAIFYLQDNVVGVSRWMSHHLGFIPIFATSGDLFTSSAFIAGLVVAIMAMPIVTSITREVFSLAPAGEREGAMALGANRWDVIRTVVLPFGRGGIVGAGFLGLGRALGETIAITLIISPTFAISPHILGAGANSIAANITLRFGSGGSLGLSALLASGFVLFVITLVVNLIGAQIVRRSRSGSGVEL